MEGDIDKHTFGAGMGSQEPSEFVDPARNIWAIAGRRRGVNEHRRFRDRLFRPKAVYWRFLVTIAVDRKIVQRLSGNVQGTT